MRRARVELALLALCALSSTRCSDLVGADFDDKFVRKPPIAQSFTMAPVVRGTLNNTGTLAGYDSDGDALTYSITAEPAYGKVVLDPEHPGHFKYSAVEVTPDKEEDPPDRGYDLSFQYQVKDSHLFARQSGTVNVRVLPFGPIEFAPETHVSNTRMGTGFDLDGKYLIVGGEDGAAYVGLRQEDGTYKFLQAIVPPKEETIESFGYSVALSGDWALIGASHWFPKGQVAPGRAFFYKRDPESGQYEFQQEVESGLHKDYDYFGFDLSIDGKRAAISAHGIEAVYTYELVNGVWQRDSQDPVTALGGKPLDHFGYDASLSGDTLAVSAAGNDDKGTDAGAAYVFQRGKDRWVQLGSPLYMAGEDVTGYALSAVALSGNQLVCGAPLAGDKIGQAAIFERGPTGEWERTPFPLINPTAGALPQFGWKVAIAGDTVAIGSQLDSSWLGSVFVYRKSTDGWKKSDELTRGRAELFSASLALEILRDADGGLLQEVLGVGATFNGGDYGDGGAFTYNLPKPGTR